MKTKVTIICENSTHLPFKLIGEYGLSMLIESETTTLFDTGHGLGLINNLQVLGKDISSIDNIVISHSHYDHTGGLMALLENYNGNIPVYVNPDSFIEKVALMETPDGQMEMPIGWPFKRHEYEEKGAEFRNIQGHTGISEKLHSFSNIKRDPDWKTWDDRLKRKDENGIIDDPFDDDLTLLVETDSGPIILLGCAHAGIVEILDYISEETGYKEFHAVIGGTHLMNAPEDYVKEAVSTLDKYKVQVIGTSHCTGFNIACRFASIFKERFVNAHTGISFEF